MSKGNIGSIIETKDVVSNNLGTAFNCIKIATGYYMVAFRDNDLDGHIATFAITESDGNIGNTVSNWEFANANTTNGCRIIKIFGTTYAIVYSTAQSPKEIYVKTFTVSDTGTITTSFVDSLTLPVTNDVPQHISDIIHISGNLYAIVYSEISGISESLGQLVTVTITSEGVISDTVVDSLNFASVSKTAVSIVKVGDTDYFAIAFIDNSNDPVVVTVDIGTDGTIAAAVTDTQVLANITGGVGNIVRVPGTDYYAVAVGRSGTAGTIYTCSINSSGAITNGSNGNFDASSAAIPYMISLGDDAFIIAYQGVDNDGFIVSITINADGTVGSIIESLEFKPSDTVVGVYILYLGSGNYAITYGAAAEDDLECVTVGVVTGHIFPSDTVARVSGIRHIFTPSSFRMQVSLGDLGFDVDVVEAVITLAEQFPGEAPPNLAEIVESGRAAIRRRTMGIVEQFPGEVPPGFKMPPRETESDRAARRRREMPITEQFPGEAPPTREQPGIRTDINKLRRRTEERRRAREQEAKPDIRTDIEKLREATEAARRRRAGGPDFSGGFT